LILKKSCIDNYKMENNEEFDYEYDFNYESDGGEDRQTEKNNANNYTNLINEQNTEYEECIQKDILHQIDKQEKEEFLKIQQNSWYYERDRKRENVPLEPGINESYTNLAFRFNIEGITRRITRRFYKSNTLKNIFDFIESQDFLPVFSQCELYTIAPMTILQPTEEKIGENFGNSTLLNVTVLV